MPLNTTHQAKRDQTIVSIENLTVKYPQQTHPAIENISLDIFSESITTLLGPNGAGKSTLIKAILNLINYKGEIRVFGRNVQEVYPQIGYVPQFKDFDPAFPMNVAEFIELSLIKSPHPKKWRQEKVHQILRSIDSSSLIQKPISTLSGGQLQRALLARALVHNPKLLILDEPEAGIDVGAEQTFYEMIAKLVEKQGITVIIASHELDVVYNYASRVICLNHQLVCDGPPNVALSQAVFEKLYGRQIKLYGRKQ